MLKTGDTKTETVYTTKYLIDVTIHWHKENRTEQESYGASFR